MQKRAESQIATCELQRGRPWDADVKVAVVTRHAPGDVKTAPRQAAHVIGDDYSRLRDLSQIMAKEATTENLPLLAQPDRTTKRPFL
eukprot:3491680-Amphidinium_carterae.1